MSSDEIREVLALAANEVPGISVARYYMQLSQLGQGCVRRDRIEYPDRFGGVGYWNVVVCLGQDMAAAEIFFEDRIPAVVEALRPVMAVRSATPQQLKLVDGTTVLAAFINGFREE